MFGGTGDIFLAEWDSLMTHWTKKCRGGANHGRRRQFFFLLALFCGRLGIEVPSVTTTYDGDKVGKGGEKIKNII